MKEKAGKLAVKSWKTLAPLLARAWPVMVAPPVTNKLSTLGDDGEERANRTGVVWRGNVGTNTPYDEEHAALLRNSTGRYNVTDIIV